MHLAHQDRVARLHHRGGGRGGYPRCLHEHQRFFAVSSCRLVHLMGELTPSAHISTMSAQTSAPPGARWFALHTLSGQEGKVKTYIEKFKKAEELDDYIFEVLLPTEIVSEVKGGKKSTKVRKLYPGYVFIQAKLYDEEGKLINKPWYFVKETTGVIGFVGGDRPAALRQKEVDEIYQRIADASGKEKPKVEY